MTRKAKTLLISLGVLLLLGGGYYGATIWQRSQIELPDWTPRDPSPRLGNLDGTRLVKIETPVMTLERIDGTWRLISLHGDTPPEGIDLDQRQISTMTFSLASVWVDSILEENPGPQEIAMYGLDNPSAWTRVVDSDGNRAEYFRGNMTPSRTAYYAMEDGDPRVYIISSFAGDNFLFDIDRIRSRSQFPIIEFQDVTHFRLESPSMSIEINPKPEIVPTHLITNFSSFVMNTPYRLLRGADNEAFNNIVEPLSRIQMGDFVEDNPSSLVPYGLDRPTRIILQSEDDSLDLLVGNQLGATAHYAMVAGEQRVFTVNGLEPVVNARPFTLVDKFALILNIDLVERINITGGSRPITARVEGQGDEAIFHLNGRRADDRPFRQWYQAVIGLLFDAEYPGPVQTQDTGEGNVVIEYELNIFPGARASVTLVPYNRDFFAVSQEGTMEFLISRNQVNRIWEFADRMVFLD